MVVIMSLVILLSGWKADHGGCLTPPCDELCQAIQDLQHPNKIVRRQAAAQISSLINTPGIQRAIRPLADVLLNKVIPSGLFTREIVSETLGRIAAQLGSPQGNRAVEALIECLENEPFDSLRSSAAYALGLSMSELALEPLQFSIENDPSPLVKFAAQEAMYRLTRSGIGLPPSASAFSLQSDSETFSVMESQLWEYQKKHIIYANPPLEEE